MGTDQRRHRDRLDEHNEYPFSHPALATRFEDRLNALERFKAQATLIGAVALILIGALITAVVERFVVHGA